MKLPLFSCIIKSCEADKPIELKAREGWPLGLGSHLHLQSGIQGKKITQIVVQFAFLRSNGIRSQGTKLIQKKIVVNCDRFLQMIFWHGNDKLRSNKLLSCTKGNTLLNWIQKENLYCSVLYKKEDYKEREREHSLKREREPQKTNVLLELATSTAWCSGPHLDVLQPPYKPWEYPMACGQTLIIICHA